MRISRIFFAAIAAAFMSSAYADPAPSSTLPADPRPADQNKKATPGVGQQNPDGGRTGTQSNTRLDINEADEAMLMKELDLNKMDAAAIVAHRKGNGKFESVSDLKAVTGLKPDTIERISGMVQYKDSAAGAPAGAPMDRGTKEDPGTKP